MTAFRSGDLWRARAAVGFLCAVGWRASDEGAIEVVRDRVIFVPREGRARTFVPLTPYFIGKKYRELAALELAELMRDAARAARAHGLQHAKSNPDVGGPFRNPGG